MGDEAGNVAETAASLFLGATPLGWLNAGAGLLGSIFGSSQLGQTSKDIKDLTTFNPFGASFGSGNVSFQNGQANFSENLASQMQRQMLLGGMSQGFGGGMFNDPKLQAALGGNDMLGALNASNFANSMMANPQAFSQMGQINNLGNLFSGMAQAGPQDYSGGMMGNLFSAGVQNQLAAGDMTGLQNQELATLRAAAQPQQDRMFNQLQNRLFSQGRLGSTGGAQDMEGLFNAFNQADLGFQGEAFNRAATRSGLLSNLGLQQTGQGAGLLGQNLGQFNQNIGSAQGFLGMGSGLENQLFQNQFNTIGQAQTAGQNRIQNAMNLFGLGTSTQNQGFQQGISAQQALGGMDQNQMTAILGLLNAEANRIGSTGMHAQALGQMGQAQGGLMSGIFGGLFG